MLCLLKKNANSTTSMLGGRCFSGTLILSCYRLLLLCCLDGIIRKYVKGCYPSHQSICNDYAYIFSPWDTWLFMSSALEWTSNLFWGSFIVGFLPWINLILAQILALRFIWTTGHLPGLDTCILWSISWIGLLMRVVPRRIILSWLLMRIFSWFPLSPLNPWYCPFFLLRI